MTTYRAIFQDRRLIVKWSMLALNVHMSGWLCGSPAHRRACTDSLMLNFTSSECLHQEGVSESTITGLWRVKIRA